jgi:hypothetical protein
MSEKVSGTESHLNAVLRVDLTIQHADPANTSGSLLGVGGLETWLARRPMTAPAPAGWAGYGPSESES